MIPLTPNANDSSKTVLPLAFARQALPPASEKLRSPETEEPLPMNAANEQIEHTKIPDQVAVARAPILEELLSRHKKSADTFRALSLAGAFGSLFFLKELEGLIPPETAEWAWALWCSWAFAYLSCVMGSIHLWLEMMFPLRVHGLAAGMPEPNEAWPEARILKRIEEKQAAYMLHHIPFFLHIVLLIGVFVCAAAYRFSNL